MKITDTTAEKKTEGAGQKTAEKKRRKKKKMGFFPILLLIVFLGSMASCVYLLFGEVDKEIGIKEMEDDIQTFMKPAAQATTAPAAPDKTGEPATQETQVPALTDMPQEDVYVFDWNGMMEQSPYVIGWIQMPGIERINYPIVQHTDDNQFFLTHDWKGNKQSAGAIFANVYNAGDFTDMNTVIYGHRMKSGSMFGLLKQYADQKFMDDNPYFYIYTPDGQKRTYEAVCCTPVTDGSDAYLTHFESPDERMAYYKMMLYSASSKRDVELDRFDTTVMLSTCNTTGYYNRVVVLGRLTAIDLNGQPENWETE